MLSDIGVDPQALQATQRVAEVFQDLTQEILKLFALENYLKKMDEEKNLLNEAKTEKRVFLETARKQVVNTLEDMKRSANAQIQQTQ